MMVVLLLLGCTEFPDCQDTRYPLAKVRFHAYETRNVSAVDFDSVIVLGNDTPLYQDTVLSALRLRFDPLADQSTYLFYADSTVDTLVLGYRSAIAMSNTDCGPIQYFIDLAPLHSSFDSVALISTIADLRVNTNVEIYR